MTKNIFQPSKSSYSEISFKIFVYLLPLTKVNQSSYFCLLRRMLIEVFSTKSSSSVVDSYAPITGNRLLLGATNHSINFSLFLGCRPSSLVRQSAVVSSRVKKAKYDFRATASYAWYSSSLSLCL